MADKTKSVAKLEMPEEIGLTDEQLMDLIAKTEWGERPDAKQMLNSLKAGRNLNHQIIGSLLLVDGMSRLGDFKDAMKSAQEIADECIDSEVRVKALGAVALAGNGYSSLLERVYKISQEVGEKRKPAAAKPEPPKFYLQVNVDKADDGKAKTGSVVEIHPEESK